MIRAAHTFGLTVVAEGVEEDAQLAWLATSGATTPRASCCPARCRRAAAAAVLRELLAPTS